MIAWIKSHSRSATICGVTLLVPLIVYLKLFLGVWGLRAEYVADIDRLEPRIARLQGIKAFESELRDSSGQVQQQLKSLAYPASSDRASIAAALQTDVRQLMSEAGLSVSNSQVLPLREEERFDFIGVKLTVSGSLDALDGALEKLNEFAPVVIIESLETWPARQSRKKGAPEVQSVTASLRLVSLRAVL